ncbi:acetylornithine aminotransferase [Candidatus Marinamargulisbacteria bacterium SCGC AG-414-C22]|nr:acetylornithine aminotransferase [Candidatus Marinamargulisbacteria bacterium SCGC AG-414-C22]
MTCYDQFINDKHVITALKELAERHAVYRDHIKGVKAAQRDHAISYDQQLQKMAQYRGQPLFFPFLGSGLGNGALVELADGSVKYDFINGIGVHWCHSDPDLIKVALQAALADTVMQGNLQQHQGSCELYALLTQITGMEHAFISTSGAMAWENAVKIAFHYKKHATRLLAFEKCFCGRTLAAAQVTDKAANRVGLPLQLPVDYIPFYDPEDSLGSIERAVTALKTILQRYPHQHACMMFELIQGEGGFNVGSRPFFVALMDVLKDHDIPIYVDEIQTFGRTPNLFAFQYFGLESYVDIVTIGKLAQVCATMFRHRLNPNPGLLSQTFTSSTVAIESAKIIIKKLKSPEYTGKKGKIVQMHDYFKKSFKQLLSLYPGDFKGPFGIGTMIAFEVFSGDPKQTMSFLRRLYHNGVLAFVAGSTKKRIRFLLPIGGVTTEAIDEVMMIIEKTYKEEKT